MPVWVRGEVVRVQGVVERALVLHPPRPADARCAAACGAGQPARGGRRPNDGTEVFVLGKPGHLRGEGRIPARGHPDASRPRPSARRSRSSSGSRRCSTRDGLFDPARKRPLPEFAATVAVVTSTDGAALRDIITVAGKRWPCCRLVVVNARVQGDGAVRGAGARAAAGEPHPGVDLCIVGRGGGAREDLAAFNSEAVCRALAAVRVPTISAVGHETDISLTDLVADVRAADPIGGRRAGGRRPPRGPPPAGRPRRRGSPAAWRSARGSARERLARTADRLQACGRAACSSGERHRADRLGAQLDALSPLRMLDRGYAVPRGSPTATSSSAAADFRPGAPSVCAWPTATSAPGWSPR